MNNKAQVTVIYGMMIGLCIIILALALAPSAVSFSTTAMNSTSGDTVGLDCTNDSISNFDKATCVVTDLSPFYLIGALIFIGGSFFTIRIIFGG